MPSLRRGGNSPLACKGGVSGALGIQIITLATPAAIMPIRRCNFQYLDPGGLQKAQQPGAVAAGRFNPDTQKIARRAHPCQHLSITLSCRGKTLCTQHMILLIDDGRNMQILVGIDTTNDHARRFFVSIHNRAPG
jgi:hypothetical protein